VTTRVLVLGMLLHAACVSPQSVVCDSGRVCPAGSTCDAATGLCVTPEQVAVCKPPVGEGASCRFNGLDGVCLGGICVPQSCGDGFVTGAEECDGDELGALDDCGDLGYYDTTPLTCGDDCRYDRDRCPAGLCGDGLRNGPEVCDGDQLEHTNCLDVGFYEPGPLTCNDACGYNTMACVGECGDGVLNGPEVCEEGQPILDTCINYGYDRGYLACARCVPDIRACRYIGWRETAITLSTQIRAIHGTARDNVFAAGSDGALLHWEGTRWTALTPATFDHFRAVVAFAPDHAVALGELGTIQRYDGTAWTLLLNDPTWRFNAVTRVGATEAFAVGNKGVMHYSGTSWSTFVAPGMTELIAIWGTSASDLYAIDTAGAFTHYTGVMWQPINLPAAAVAVWGNSATDVYVSTASAIYHLVNNSWPTIGITATGVTAGTGVGGTDVCLAGGPPENFVWCHTGGYWNLIAGFAIGFGPVSAMWGSGPDDVFLAGSAGVYHFDGSAWFGTNVTSAPRSFWGDATVVYAANGSVLRSTGNGNFVTALTPASGQALYGVWGSSPSDVFAVGQAGNIQRFNGSTWSKLTNADTRALSAVWGSSGTNVYAVGSTGAILRYTGTWASVTSGTTASLFDVWGSSATDIFAVGTSGTIVHSTNGTTFAPMVSGTTHDLRGVFGTSASDVYAVGDLGTILHYNGTSWTSVVSGTGTALNDVWASSATDVFVGGDFGTMLYFDGSTWTPVNRPNAHIVGVYGIGNILYVSAVGESVLMLLRLAPWN
jgi:hypothetical protein